MQTDNTLTGPVAVYEALALAGLSNTYSTIGSTEYDTGARLMELDVQQEDDPYFYVATARYSTSKASDPTRVGRADGGRQGSPGIGSDPKEYLNPLLRAPEIELGFSPFQRALQFDREQALIANAAGDPFDPPYQVDDSRATMTVTRNELNYRQDWRDWHDVVNSDVFMGTNPGNVKLKGIQAKFQYENNLAFWRVTYPFEWRDDGFTVQDGPDTFRAGWNPAVILNQGMRYKSGSTLINIDPNNGQPFSRPILLDASGGQLATGGTPSYMLYEVYARKAFGDLNIVIPQTRMYAQWGSGR